MGHDDSHLDSGFEPLSESELHDEVDRLIQANGALEETLTTLRNREHALVSSVRMLAGLMMMDIDTGQIRPGSIRKEALAEAERLTPYFNFLFSPETCPAHVPSYANTKVCRRCGAHFDDERPPESCPDDLASKIDDIINDEITPLESKS